MEADRVKGEQMSERRVTTCPRCGPTVPMVWTFAFMGCEWWCPCCGYGCGCGSGDRQDATPALTATLKDFEKKSADYLNATGSRIATKTLFAGEWLHWSEFPAAERARREAVIKGWMNLPIPGKAEYLSAYKARLIKRGLPADYAAELAADAEYCGEAPDEAESHADDEISYMAQDHDPGAS